ncbi:MAG: diaminopimelate epimerase [Nitrospinota bacterium]|nr:diaminopimelate epimerase [Nitrospinota bacterium]
MAKEVKFSKWHGLGNDFVIVDDRAGKFRFGAALLKKLGDRHYGIGFDQFMVVRKPSNLSKAAKARGEVQADFRMELYNSDGSIAEMCGNGIRCFAMFLKERKITKKANLAVETGAGIIRTSIKGKLVEVDMGEPILDGPKIPVHREGRMISQPVNTKNGFYSVTAVSMGNPHAVIFVNDVAKVELEKDGPMLETHPSFPNRTNVEFAQVESRNSINLRVWERGAGATLACGTGACATAVAGVLNNLSDRIVSVNLPGGTLKIRWDEGTNRVFMTGPAVEVFNGAFLI